jgi:hypothetical protein
VPTVLKSDSLKLLEPSGSVQTCNGIALLLSLPFIFNCYLYLLSFPFIFIFCLYLFTTYKNTGPTAQRTHSITEINPLTPELNLSAQRCLPRFLMVILIFKGLTARRLDKYFGVKRANLSL